MGIERSVTYWYIQRQTILNEIASLEEQLKQASAPLSLTDGQVSAVSDAKGAEFLRQLARARERLKSLGPCPKPMMG